MHSRVVLLTLLMLYMRGETMQMMHERLIIRRWQERVQCEEV